MRLRSGTIRVLTLMALVSAALLGGGAPAAFAQDATPAAGTPVVEPAEPVVETATTNVVTLVAWYSSDPSGEFLNVLPIRVGDDRVASADPNGQAIGRIELPLPGEGLPTIEVDGSTFEGYLRYEGDIPERWIWTNDTEGIRPATMLIQIQGTSGTYQNFYGTATFVSRDDAAGGVLILALRPPEPEALEEAAAEEAASGEEVVDEAPVEEAPVEEAPVEEAPVEEAPAEEGTGG